MSTERERALALLEAQHEFPCDYTIKVVFRASESSPQAIEKAVSALGRSVVVGTSQRSSKRGNYGSITLTVHVESAEQVLEVYALARGENGVVMCF